MKSTAPSRAHVGVGGRKELIKGRGVRFPLPHAGIRRHPWGKRRMRRRLSSTNKRRVNGLVVMGASVHLNRRLRIFLARETSV